MKRLFVAFFITITIGLSIYLLSTIFHKEGEEKNSNEEIIENTYEFDISYANTIKLESLLDTINNNEKTVILIGNKEESETKKVSSLLGNIDGIESLNIYYMEKEESWLDSSSYQDLLINYPELSNYISFTPVLLVFKQNTFVGGLPGEVEERNITQFFKYTEIMN